MFHAKWSKDSSTCLIDLKDFFEEYLVSCRVGFVDCDLEENQSLCNLFGIDCVPTAIMVTPNLQVVKKIDEIDLTQLYEDIETQVVIYNQNYEIQKIRGINKVTKVLKQHNRVLFAKNEWSESTRSLVGKFASLDMQVKMVS